MGRLAARGFRKSLLPLLAEAGEGLVGQEAAPERVLEVARQAVDLEAAGRAMQGDPQVSLVVLPVEVAQERHEGGRQDEHVLGIAERVAQQHARPVGDGGGHHVEVPTEGRQRTRHERPWYIGCAFRPESCVPVPHPPGID